MSRAPHETGYLTDGPPDVDEPPDDRCLWTVASGRFCLSADVAAEGQRFEFDHHWLLCAKHATVAKHEGWLVGPIRRG